MTEPLPTDALRRLEALIKGVTGFDADGTLSIDSETFMAVYIEHCTRQALLPWVAVPCGEEVVLVRIDDGNFFYCENGIPKQLGLHWQRYATRFPDPLTALEKLRTETSHDRPT